MRINRRKILSLCLCFWAFSLALATIFRLEKHRILTSASSRKVLPATIKKAGRVAEKPEASPAAPILRNWQEWRRRPDNWTRTQKEDFFRQHCRDIIDAGQKVLNETQNR
ncbi:MAG: hypothetical protein AB1403_05430 [Candidatus Riflebacteria bacterium]